MEVKTRFALKQVKVHAENRCRPRRRGSSTVICGSCRGVTNNDQVELAPLSSLNVSLRYSLRLFNRPCSARLDVANVTNETGLTISSLYAVVPLLRRNYTLTLATDI